MGWKGQRLTNGRAKWGGKAHPPLPPPQEPQRGACTTVKDTKKVYFLTLRSWRQSQCQKLAVRLSWLTFFLRLHVAVCFLFLFFSFFFVLYPQRTWGSRSVPSVGIPHELHTEIGGISGDQPGTSSLFIPLGATVRYIKLWQPQWKKNKKIYSALLNQIRKKNMDFFFLRVKKKSRPACWFMGLM